MLLLINGISLGIERVWQKKKKRFGIENLGINSTPVSSSM